MNRERFEAWISAPPFERSVERQGTNGAWPGQYRSYETQAAWEAWQESAKIERADGLVSALRDIAKQDPVELALDPQWAQRIARISLTVAGYDT